MIMTSSAALIVGRFARLILYSLLVASVPMLPALAQSPGRISDVDVSWRKGVAYVPGKVFRTSPTDIETDKPYPVVIYMHGCSGISQTDNRWGAYLKEIGYIVVQPDSTRRDRPISCDPRSFKAGLFPGVLELRLEEVHFAREQVERAAWADKSKIFLMGHSEGGRTVALTTRTDFRGVIVSAHKCGFGLRTPAAVPLLAIDHETDPWYPGAASGACAQFFGGRENARMLTLRGNDHDTFEAPAKEAVQRFLHD